MEIRTSRGGMGGRTQTLRTRTCRVMSGDFIVRIGFWVLGGQYTAVIIKERQKKCW